MAERKLSMNWRRGLVQIWVAISAVWIVGSIWYSNPIARITALQEPVILTSSDNQFEFPPNLPISKIRTLLIKWAQKEQAKIGRKKLAHQPLTAYERLIDGESPMKAANEIIGTYTPSVHDTLSSIAFDVVEMALLPPIGVLFLGFVFLRLGQGIHTDQRPN